MTDNPLTVAIAQVSALVADIRERGEAAGEQVSAKLAEGVEEASSALASSAGGLSVALLLPLGFAVLAFLLAAFGLASFFSNSKPTLPSLATR